MSELRKDTVNRAIYWQDLEGTKPVFPLGQTGIWNMAASQAECGSGTRNQELGAGPVRQVVPSGRGQVRGWGSPSSVVNEGQVLPRGTSSATLKLHVLLQAHGEFGRTFWEVSPKKQQKFRHPHNSTL